MQRQGSDRSAMQAKLQEPGRSNYVFSEKTIKKRTDQKVSQSCDEYCAWELPFQRASKTHQKYIVYVWQELLHVHKSRVPTDLASGWGPGGYGTPNAQIESERPLTKTRTPPEYDARTHRTNGCVQHGKCTTNSLRASLLYNVMRRSAISCITCLEFAHRTTFETGSGICKPGWRLQPDRTTFGNGCESCDKFVSDKISL